MSIVTEQVPVPLQAPDQPVKFDDASGVAVSVITEPVEKVLEHVDPQVIPAGDDVTDPLPVPDLATESAYCDAGRVLLTSVARSLSTFAALYAVTVK
jgi:hypothetical protein